MADLLIVAPGGRLDAVAPILACGAPEFQAPARRAPADSCKAAPAPVDPRRPPMLNTRQKVLRNFWYATCPIEALKDGPKPFRLLGQTIVLFLDEKGEPAALEDRCCHRTAKLSKGWIKDGHIVCGYHGWEYDRDRQAREHPAVPVRAGGARRAREGVPRQGALRLCLGLPRRAAARHSRPPGGPRPGLPPHPSVRRLLELLGACG